MVTRSEVVRMALRHDTYMADCFLRACGVRVRPARAPMRGERPDATYAGMRECFENRVRVGYREAVMARGE